MTMILFICFHKDSRTSGLFLQSKWERGRLRHKGGAQLSHQVPAQNFPGYENNYQKENFHFNLVFLQWVLLNSHLRVSNILSTSANQVECWLFTLKEIGYNHTCTLQIVKSLGNSTQELFYCNHHVTHLKYVTKLDQNFWYMFPQ